MSKSNRAVLLFAFLVPFFIGCQKETSEPEEIRTPFVEAANGDLFDVGCLRQSVDTIRQAGPTAMESCKFSGTLASSVDEGVEKGRLFHNSSYATVYYPPYYYSPSYNYTNYSSYNSNDYFCQFVFGSSWDLNCYWYFGYSPSYTTYYRSDCDGCLFAKNPTKCLNRCYRQTYYWY
jgi:hypothetical protein